MQKVCHRGGRGRKQILEQEEEISERLWVPEEELLIRNKNN
jgi:hypothetical protein